VSTAYPTADEAYRAAAELSPPPVRRAPEPIEVEWRFVDQDIEVQPRDMVAIGGGVLALVAGAMLGSWLHIPL